MSPAPGRSRLEQCAWLLPTLLGMSLGLLPYLTQRIAHGTWFFIGDNDDAYYAMVARAPFHGGWSLRDPFANAREAIGAPYAWGLFVPMAKLAAIFGDTPVAFLIGWRALGGALLGAGLWLFLVTIFRRCGARLGRLAGPWGVSGLAAVIACIMLVDPGFDFASLPFERLLTTARNLLFHHFPRTNPGWYGHLRVVSPVCGLGFLFGLLALLSQPRLNLRIALLSGLLLGILFNVHFFFWTAPVGLLVVLLVVQFLPGRIRRWFGIHQPPVLLVLILVLGIACGLPQFLRDLSSFKDPIIREVLERTPRGIALAWHNPARWIYLKGPRLWLDCALVSLAAVRVRALRVAALLALLSFALVNSAVVTGLEFENYKWLHAFQTISYLSCWVWGLSELARLRRDRPEALFTKARTGVAVVLGIATLLAAIWIPRECLATPEAEHRSQWQAELQGLEPVLSQFAPDASLVAPVSAQPALLFTSCGVLYETPYTAVAFISDAEVIQRQALSAWVLGEDRSRLDLKSQLRPSVLGETRPQWSHLRADYERSVANSRVSDLDKFRVRYALTLCATPPSPETGTWRELAHSDRWCAWERAAHF